MNLRWPTVSSWPTSDLQQDGQLAGDAGHFGDAGQLFGGGAQFGYRPWSVAVVTVGSWLAFCINPRSASVNQFLARNEKLFNNFILRDRRVAMKSFWVTPARGSDCLPLVGKVRIAAGDEHGALFSGVFEEPTRGARTLTGYLQFPERTQESMFRGSLTALK